MITKGPSKIPFNPNSSTPPIIEKNINKGWILIRSFKNKGLKKLSTKLIKKALKHKNNIPSTIPFVKRTLIPRGNQTRAQPTIGTKELNIINTENNKEPLMPNEENMIKAAKD